MTTESKGEALDLNKTRAEFEAEAARRNINVERSRVNPDLYKYEYASQMWDFWQAAERAALARAGSEAPTAQQAAIEQAYKACQQVSSGFDHDSGERLGARACIAVVKALYLAAPTRQLAEPVEWICEDSECGWGWTGPASPAPHCSFCAREMSLAAPVSTAPAIAAPAATAEPKVPEGWKLVKESRLLEIAEFAVDPSENAYGGRGLYDDGIIRKNWVACVSRLDSIKDHLHAIIEGWDDDELAELPAAPTTQHVSAAPAVPTTELLRRLAANPYACYLIDTTTANVETLLAAPTAAQKEGASEQDAALEPIAGDLLPPVGSKVLIHLGRQDAWVEHIVSGYYVWGALSHQVREGEKNAHRVFVRLKDADGYDNARLLSEVRPVAAMSAAQAQPKDTTDTRRDA